MKVASAPKKTKELIINLLSEQWPLRTKQIHSLLKKQGLSVTYQAIHLSLKELEEEGVLIHEKKSHYLNPIWISSQAKRFNNLAELYTKENKLSEHKKYQELTFLSLTECWNFLVNNVQSGFFGDSDKCYLQVGRLLAPPLPKEHLDFLKQYSAQKKVVIMCRRNGIIDKFAANYLRSIGVTVYTGIPCALPTNTLLVGDCVVSIHVLYPENEENRMAILQRNPLALVNKNFLEYFSDIMLKKMTVKIIINRDPDVRRDVLIQTLRLLSTPKTMH